MRLRAIEDDEQTVIEKLKGWKGWENVEYFFGMGGLILAGLVIPWALAKLL
jgi:hypothetical protein